MVERVLFGPGGATQATLATRLSEATFAAEDFATQVTLEAARVLLASISTSVDGLEANTTGLATQATLATRLSEATFVAEDFATQVTLEAARVLLVTISTKDFATQATLVQVRDRADFPIPAAQVTALSPLAVQPVSGTVGVNNFPATQPVSGPITDAQARATPIPVSGAVALDAPTLAALEVIGLDTATLAALETISVQNFPVDYPDAATLAKVEAIRVLLAATLTVQGTVGVSGSVEVVNDLGNPLPISGTVAVSGTVPVSAASLPLPSGASTAAKQPAVVGTWGYRALASGTITLTGSKRVIGIAAHATTAGSFTINGGDSIPVPANTSVEFQPLGNVIDAVVVFTGTDSAIVEHVS